MSDAINTADIELSERYDQEDDIYYVTVKTGEPSLVKEIDDILFLEEGIFSGMPTGFRIMNFTKNKLAVGKFTQIFKQRCKQAGLRRAKESKATERRLNKFVEKVMA